MLSDRRVSVLTCAHSASRFYPLLSGSRFVQVVVSMLDVRPRFATASGLGLTGSFLEVFCALVILPPPVMNIFFLHAAFDGLHGVFFSLRC